MPCRRVHRIAELVLRRQVPPPASRGHPTGATERVGRGRLADTGTPGDIDQARTPSLLHAAILTTHSKT